MEKSYELELTSAVAIGGEIKVAKSRVTVDEATAKNLLHRGKAKLAEVVAPATPEPELKQEPEPEPDEPSEPDSEPVEAPEQKTTKRKRA
jgi:hypothetical protein